MLPVLAASAKGEVRIGQVVEQRADQMNLSPEERGELLPSGQQTVFSNRVHWAKSYLNKAGLIEITRRGHFRITDGDERFWSRHRIRSIPNFLCSLRNSGSFGSDPSLKWSLAQQPGPHP